MSRYSRFGAFPGWILTAALLGGVAYAYFSNWLCPINRVLCINCNLDFYKASIAADIQECNFSHSPGLSNNPMLQKFIF
jgi:hypothetical protein